MEGKTMFDDWSFEDAHDYASKMLCVLIDIYGPKDPRLLAFARWCVRQGGDYWNCPIAAKRWLETGEEEILDEAKKVCDDLEWVEGKQVHNVMGCALEYVIKAHSETDSGCYTIYDVFCHVGEALSIYHDLTGAGYDEGEASFCCLVVDELKRLFRSEVE